jgi:nucleoside-diphosphate-sugar epimerase
MSFTPEQLTEAICKHLPGFYTEYKPDYRQAIAESWPGSIDDSAARNDWGWKEEYGLERMVEDMLQHV